MGGGLLQAASASSTAGMNKDGITDDIVSSLEHIPKNIALLRGGVERDPSAVQGVPEIDRELVRDDAAVCGSRRDSLHGDRLFAHHKNGRRLMFAGLRIQQSLARDPLRVPVGKGLEASLADPVSVLCLHLQLPVPKDSVHEKRFAVIIRLRANLAQARSLPYFDVGMPIGIDGDVQELDRELCVYPDLGPLAFRRDVKALASDFILAEEDLEVIGLGAGTPSLLGGASKACQECEEGHADAKYAGYGIRALHDIWFLEMEVCVPCFGGPGRKALVLAMYARYAGRLSTMVCSIKATPENFKSR